MIEPNEEEDPGFLLALVLNFPPSLGAMPKSQKEKREKKKLKKKKKKPKTKGRLHKKD